MSEEPTPEIPGYRLLRRLGRGAAGVVYLAEAQDDLGRNFAVKVFPPDAAAHYARELATLREVEAVRRESGSRDLLEVVHAGDAHGQAFVVMEYCPGGDLLSRVRDQGPLESEEALRLLIPVARALELLHAHGWVHKDVKPANVLLGVDGLPRLGDFGLTRALDGPLSSAGTPGFCAPEVYKGGDATASGVQLDVYSAAATLYFVLTGEAPLPGRPDVFPLERRRVPRALQRVLLAGLRVDPAQRLGSARELRELLERVQRGESALDPPARRWP
ncbi:MAG: serine/threonine protein kinase, partial [Planctomycetes bacterium]|nr:serine/threonine protein kinase [Planctomycetota bacterium]